MSGRPRLVLDASAGLHAAMGLELAGPLLESIEQSTIVLAPSIYCAEVANGLYKYVKAQELTLEQALEMYETALRLVDHQIAELEIAQEALVTAVLYQHPVYDGIYAVLARRNGCPVLTLDRRLVRLLDQMQVKAIHPERSR